MALCIAATIMSGGMWVDQAVLGVTLLHMKDEKKIE